MTTAIKATFATAALLLASATTAQAGDPAKLLGGELAGTSEVQRLVDSCEAAESTSRAVRACTKLIKMAPTSETRGAFTTRRALHRLALGEFERAAADFDRAGRLTGNESLGSLGTGYAALMDSDLTTARAQFEDCTSRAGLAPLAHYGLGLTYQAAGRNADARDSYQEALALRPGWSPAQAQMQTLG